MANRLTSFRVQRRRHGKHLLPDSEALLASLCLSPGGPNSLQIIRIRAAGAGRPRSAGLVSEGRGNRGVVWTARGFSALCLPQTGTLRVGATDGPSWEAAPQRGSLKLFSSLELQESPSEQKDSPGPRGGWILRILTHCCLALRCCQLDPVFASVAACPLPVCSPGLQHCECICPLGCLFSTLVSLYPQGRK